MTDKGLEQLNALSNLEALDLHRTQVSDARLGRPESIAKLRELNLGVTPVTDAGTRNSPTAVGVANR